MVKRIFSILAILSVAAIVLTGCKGEEATDTGGGTATATAGATAGGTTG